jgi:shikimate kinase
MDPRIVILGFMGSGKTTVAKALAARLECGLVDLDAIISAQQNLSVPELIRERGEPVFREAETEALQIVLDRQQPRIIALGGGAWINDRNRELIKQHGCLTVFLDASFELCWKRITNHPVDRPMALDEASAARLHRERRAYYAQARIRIVVSETATADQLAAEIIEASKRCV